MNTVNYSQPEVRIRYILINGLGSFWNNIKYKMLKHKIDLQRF